MTRLVVATDAEADTRGRSRHPRHSRLISGALLGASRLGQKLGTVREERRKQSRTDEERRDRSARDDLIKQPGGPSLGFRSFCALQYRPCWPTSLLFDERSAGNAPECLASAQFVPPQHPAECGIDPSNPGSLRSAATEIARTRAIHGTCSEILGRPQCLSRVALPCCARTALQLFDPPRRKFQKPP